MRWQNEPKKIKEKLLEKNADRPVEWWAGQLAKSRVSCYYGFENTTRANQRAMDAENEADCLLSINRNMAILLNKMGIPTHTLRVTFTEYELPDDTVCEGCAECCDECDAIESYDKTELLRVHDYCILGEVLDAILCDFTSKRINAKKILDITDQKHPVVLFEAEGEA